MKVYIGPTIKGFITNSGPWETKSVHFVVGEPGNHQASICKRIKDPTGYLFYDDLMRRNHIIRPERMCKSCLKALTKRGVKTDRIELTNPFYKEIT